MALLEFASGSFAADVGVGVWRDICWDDLPILARRSLEIGN